MAPHGLTVLARIEPGQEAALRRVLNEIGDDVKGKRLAETPDCVHIHFGDSHSIHFARLVILDDPDSGLGRQRLLFATDYDGSLESHLGEILEITTDPDAVFGKCVGYKGKESFEAFIRAHSLEPGAYYIAFRDETMESIRGTIRVRQRLEAMLDAGEPVRAPAGHGVLKTLAGALAKIADYAVRGVLVLADVAMMLLRFGPANTLRAGKKVAATLDRLWYVRIFNRLTFNSFPGLEHPYSEIDPEICYPCTPQAPGDEVASAGDEGPIQAQTKEDVITQNQLTLVTVIDPAQLKYAGAVLAVINLFARRLAPSGSLAGISTIHFVRWLIIDDGKRLLMLSNYDGSWEAYIGEFAEMILSGLDAIWGSALGYPSGGAQDLPAFKRFLRCHQTQSEVFYSAYPRETVLNIIDDHEIARIGASLL